MSGDGLGLASDDDSGMKKGEDRKSSREPVRQVSARNAWQDLLRKEHLVGMTEVLIVSHVSLEPAFCFVLTDKFSVA
jgi:hypothetical protein